MPGLSKPCRPRLRLPPNALRRHHEPGRSSMDNKLLEQAQILSKLLDDVREDLTAGQLNWPEADSRLQEACAAAESLEHALKALNMDHDETPLT